MKSKGDTGGNRTGEKRKGRRINHSSFCEVEGLCFTPVFPWKSLNSIANDPSGRRRRAKSQPQSGARNGTERLWNINRNNEEFWRRGRTKRMERRTAGNHPGGWETLTWWKKNNVFYHEGKKSWNTEKLQKNCTRAGAGSKLSQGWTQSPWRVPPSPQGWSCGSTPEPSGRAGKSPESGIISNKKRIFQLEALNLFPPQFHTFPRKCDYWMKTMELGGGRSHFYLLK